MSFKSEFTVDQCPSLYLFPSFLGKLPSAERIVLASLFSFSDTLSPSGTCLLLCGMRLLPLLALLELAHSYEEVSDEQDIVCAAAGFLVLADAVSKVRCRHYLRKAALPPIQVLSHARADADALSEAHEHARSTRARAHSCIGAGSRLWWCMTTLRARCSLLSVSLCVSIVPGDAKGRCESGM